MARRGGKRNRSDTNKSVSSRRNGKSTLWVDFHITWAAADAARDEATAKGIVLEDGPDGTTWQKA